MALALAEAELGRGRTDDGYRLLDPVAMGPVHHDAGPDGVPIADHGARQEHPPGSVDALQQATVEDVGITVMVLAALVVMIVV